jgi:hypothetical protein
MSFLGLEKKSFDNLYIYNLKLQTKNDIFNFCYSDTNKYANIIDSYSNILYKSIIYYEITIEKGDISYHLCDTINPNTSFYSNNNANIYIEFSQDNNGFLNCICYYTNKDIDNLCISPF